MYGIERILVATDFSPDAARALDCAKDIARRFGAEILLLHVDETLATMPTAGPASERRAKVRAELQGRLAVLEAKDLPVQARLRPGTPVTEILHVAEAENAGLIVLGRRGSATLGDLLLGSVADRVIRKSTVPVLVVPHPPEEHPVNVPTERKLALETVQETSGRNRAT